MRQTASRRHPEPRVDGGHLDIAVWKEGDEVADRGSHAVGTPGCGMVRGLT
jgi:hypothetical protein